MSMRKSPSGYITGRPVVYPVVRLHNRSIAGHPYGTHPLHLAFMHSHHRKMESKISEDDLFAGGEFDTYKVNFIFR